jgi:asparagine synthase (glutamine-hydrolysing)
VYPGSDYWSLVALLQKKNKPLYTFFSVLPPGHGIEKDEGKDIESIGRYYPNIIQTFVDDAEIGSIESLKESFSTDQSIPNSFHYLDKALLKVAREKNIHTLFTGYGGDFGVSWKGDTVIYQLIRKGKYKDALQLLKEFKNRQDRSLAYLFLKKYLSHTYFYERLRPLIKMGKISWHNETTLKDDFVKKHQDITLQP